MGVENVFKLLVKFEVADPEFPCGAKAIDIDEFGNIIPFTFSEWINYKCGEHVDVNTSMSTVRFDIPIPEVILSVECSRIPVIAVAPNLENLWKRDRGMCGYCGEHVKLSKATRDHIYPQCLGGSDDWKNLVLACKQCNGTKANILLEDIDDMELQYEINRPNPLSLIYRMSESEVENMPELWKNFFVEYK
jgi:5-methylcytosine-specific restriction endonuclease McrA